MKIHDRKELIYAADNDIRVRLLRVDAVNCKQRTMFEQSKVIILPIFKRHKGIANEEAFGRRFMDFAEIWCVIENLFLAIADEGLANTMRIPTDKQLEQILQKVGCPDDYILPCIIGIGYAAENAEYPTQIYPKLEDCIKW